MTTRPSDLGLEQVVFIMREQWGPSVACRDDQGRVVLEHPGLEDVPDRVLEPGSQNALQIEIDAVEAVVLVLRVVVVNRVFQFHRHRRDRISILLLNGPDATVPFDGPNPMSFHSLGFGDGFFGPPLSRHEDDVGIGVEREGFKDGDGSQVFLFVLLVPLLLRINEDVPTRPTLFSFHKSPS